MPPVAGRALRLPRFLPVALLVLALLAPLAAASGASPPAEAARVDVGTRVAYHWAVNGTSEGDAGANDTLAPPAASFEPGERGAIRVAALMDQQDANATAIVWEIAISSDTLAFPTSNVTLRKEYANVTTSEAFHFGAFPLTVPSENGTFGYTINFTVLAEENGTLVPLASALVDGSILVATVEPPLPPAPPGGLPTAWLLAGAAVLVVGGGATAIAIRQRNIRRRMNEAPRRSQVMREMELEQKLEKAKTKDPAQAVVIQQEIRQAERVREERRELQILEAKRADALKTLDLLRKRHEAGGLTKLQYTNMVAKKQADLERIEAEIAQMRGDDASAAS